MTTASWKKFIKNAEKAEHIVVRFGESTREGGFGAFSKRSLVPESWCFKMDEGGHDICSECARVSDAHYYVWCSALDRWKAICPPCFRENTL